jgi:hypothetical protein
MSIALAEIAGIPAVGATEEAELTDDPLNPCQLP